MPRKIEVAEIRTPKAGGEYSAQLFHGQTRDGLRSNFEDVIILAHGWLGKGTMRFVAMRLASEGHDVAVVNNSKVSLLHPNAHRSQNVHFTARAASQATGKRGVIFIGHSNGSQDVHHATGKALERQRQEPDNDELYVVRAVGAVAGAGLSGRWLHPQDMRNEALGAIKNLVEHPNEELQVVGQSILNFYRHPLLSVVEGVGAVTCDVRPDAGQFVSQGGARAYGELYLDKDGVIPLPQGRSGFEVVSGTHLTPVVDGDLLVEFAESLYEQQDLSAHELRQFRPAA